MRIGYGIAAGFAATLVLSALMLIKGAVGLMPQLDAVAMLANMGAQYADLPNTAAVGWVLHFVIGAVLWGVLFALTFGLWPGDSYTVKGISFSVAAWLLMMIMIMPMAGAGLFGLNLGIGAPIATLMLHVIFGAVLGAVYGSLVGSGQGSVVTR